MKKFIYIFIIIIAIIILIFYNYQNYKIKYNEAKRENAEFEKYLDKEITGTELTTIINKAMDYNYRNGVKTNEKNIIIKNNENSIKIDIKMLDDNNKIYPMEAFYNMQMEKFVEYYRSIKFKCTQINYHKDTYKVKYLLFEQITQ